MARNSLKAGRRQATVRERGTGRSDVSRDVTDDAAIVLVADWLLQAVGHAPRDGEVGVMNMYEVVVWTGHATPDWRLRHALRYR